MKRFFIVLLILGVFSVLGYAKNITSNSSSIYVDSAITFILQQNYNGATRLLTEYLKFFPTDRKANYFLFATEQIRLLDYESYCIDYDNFLHFCCNIKENLEDRIEELRGVDSTICLFYVANIFGGMSVAKAKCGRWFEGLRDGLNAYSLFKNVKNRDTSFIAADLGIGIFNYYIAKTIKILPFISVDEKEGIRLIRSAINSDFPFNYAAKNSLCWILIDKKDFKSADSIAQSVLYQYPDNTIFLRIKAHAALWGGDYNNALSLGRKMIEISAKRDPINWSDLVAGYMILLSSENKLNKKIELCKDIEAFSNLNIPYEFSELTHIKKNIKIIDKICKDNCGENK